MMKMTTKWLTAAVILLTTALYGQAQETDSHTPLAGNLNFLAVKDFAIKTKYAIKGDEVQEWNEDRLHTGLLSCSFLLFNCNDIQRDIEYPDIVTLNFLAKDTEGNEVNSESVDLSSTFKKVKFSKNFKHQCSCLIAINRGGEYVASTSIDPDLYKNERAIVVYDEECMRVADKHVKVGEVLSPKLTFTSGFPYNPEDFSTEKNLTWKVARADNPSDVIAEHTENFAVTSISPKLAAEATLSLPVGELEAGKYNFTITSDYAPACRTFEATVYDVLKADVSLNQLNYSFGKDTEAKVTLDLKYGYPYITAEADEIPTITVTTEFLNQVKHEKFSDMRWQNDPLDFAAEIDIPFKNVTKEVLDTYNGEVPLAISVSFNNQVQYETTITIPFNGYSGIIDISTDKALQSPKPINLLGVPVDESYHGIIITSDGRKIIK